MLVLAALAGALAYALGRQRPADAACVWLEMAGPLAQFGQWRRAGSLEWSAEMYRIHGVNPGAFVPGVEAVLALFQAEDRAEVAAVLAQGGEARVRLRRPDAETRHVILCGQMRGAEVLGVLVDVTGQWQAEARALEANEAARRASEALREITLEDALTGLFNRRRFEVCLAQEFKRAVRSGQNLGLVLIELDGLDAFTRQFGQAAGYECLRRVAQAVKAVPRRAGDLVARYEGARMAVLLPLADDFGAARVAEAMLDVVRGLGGLNVSCGVAAFIGLAELSQAQELVRRAELALEEARYEGGGQVCRFEMRMNDGRRGVYHSGLVS